MVKHFLEQGSSERVKLGLRQNLGQFGLLVGVNALVGGMVGQERTVLPLLAVDEFGLTAFTSTLTFIAAFGIVKAITPTRVVIQEQLPTGANGTRSISLEFPAATSKQRRAPNDEELQGQGERVKSLKSRCIPKS